LRNEFPVQNSPIKLREYIHELPHTQASRVNLPATLFSGNFIQIKGLYIYILLKIIIQAALMVLNTDFFFKQTFKGEKQDHIGAREYILKMYMQQNPDPDRSCYSHFTVATGYFTLIDELLPKLWLFRSSSVVGNIENSTKYHQPSLQYSSIQRQRFNKTKSYQFWGLIGLNHSIFVYWLEYLQ